MIKFARVLNAFPFNDCIYLPGTYVEASEEALTPIVAAGDAEWCDDPTPPPPAPPEAPAP